MNNNNLQKSTLTLQFPFFCPLEVFREVIIVIAIMNLRRQTENEEMNENQELYVRRNFISFGEKIMEGAVVVSGKPGTEVSIDFESTAEEYAIAGHNSGSSTQFYSKQPGLTDKYADKAILLALFRKKLKESFLTPDVEILPETGNTLFLKDINKDN